MEKATTKNVRITPPSPSCSFKNSNNVVKFEAETTFGKHCIHFIALSYTHLLIVDSIFAELGTLEIADFSHGIEFIFKAFIGL